MFIIKTPTSLMGHRLNPEFYNPEARRVDEQLEELSNGTSLDKLIDPNRIITNGVRGPSLVDSPYKFVRLQDCKAWQIDFDGCKTISEKQYQENIRCRLTEGDVVVAIGGYLGRAAVVNRSINAVIGQHSALLPMHAGGRIEPRYLVAYLNSRCGRIQFERLVRGSVQAGLNLEDVKEISVPVFHLMAQTYIGSKVRQAEALREAHKRNLDAARLLVEALIEKRVTEQQMIDAQVALEAGKTGPDDDLVEDILSRGTQNREPNSIVRGDSPPNKHVRVSTSALSEERLDTGFYSPEYFAAKQLLAESGVVNETIGDVAEPWQFGAYALCNEIQWTGPEGIPYLKVEAVGKMQINEDKLSYVNKKTHDLLDKSQLSPGDIIVGTSGSIGGVAVIPEQYGRCNSNQATMKFNPSAKGYEPYFVSAWLASCYGQTFMSREAGGAVQQHIYIYNFKRLPLIKPDKLVQTYIGRKVIRAEALRHAYKGLVDGARQLVEALIEGDITEEGLADAQADLEAGKSGKDRDILEKLTTTGFDDGGTPIFSDLNELYRLLNETTSTRGQDGD